VIRRGRAAWNRVTTSEVEAVRVESLLSRHGLAGGRHHRHRVWRSGKHLNKVGHFFLDEWSERQ
jgi:hypothetical protein